MEGKRTYFKITIPCLENTQKTVLSKSMQKAKRQTLAVIMEGEESGPVTSQDRDQRRGSRHPSISQGL